MQEKRSKRKELQNELLECKYEKGRKSRKKEQKPKRKTGQ